MEPLQGETVVTNLTIKSPFSTLSGAYIAYLIMNEDDEQDPFGNWGSWRAPQLVPSLKTLPGDLVFI